MKRNPEVTAYINSFPTKTQKILREVRTVIANSAPDAEEIMSYGMPTYKMGKPLVYFAGYTNHIGFYATPTGHVAFKKELSKYKQGKGSVQFPLDAPMPLSLIKKIVRYRVQEIKKSH